MQIIKCQVGTWMIKTMFLKRKKKRKKKGMFK
jgi:hypothetical protein